MLRHPRICCKYTGYVINKYLRSKGTVFNYICIIFIFATELPCKQTISGSTFPYLIHIFQSTKFYAKKEENLGLSDKILGPFHWAFSPTLYGVSEITFTTTTNESTRRINYYIYLLFRSFSSL